MSKKLAVGSDGVVLDVKTGRGAFTKSYEEAMNFAKTLVDIGEGAGRRTVAWITAMEQPLDCAVGNAIEVREAIDTLRGSGLPDLVELTMELGNDMLSISGIVSFRKKVFYRTKAYISLSGNQAMTKIKESLPSISFYKIDKIPQF